MSMQASAAVTAVLVHGAFADGSSWRKVIPLLEDQGMVVVVVQNPLTSLADDVAATRRAIAQTKGPVVLVGHSWGGAVITEAGTDSKVKALVYVAAFAPDAGQSVNDTAKGAPPPAWLKRMVVDQAGFMTLTPQGIVEDFAQDLPAAEQEVLAARQGPTAARALDDKLTVAAWSQKPSWYVVATNDHMIPPPAEEAWAKRMNANTTELASSHVAMLTKPKEVTAVITEAAANVAQGLEVANAR